MGLKSQFERLAAYNQWMNTRVYEAAGTLSTANLAQDRGAFFGSILGTLNHLLVADILWLKRFAAHPACRHALRDMADIPQPTSLDQILCADLGSLSERRAGLDRLIIDCIAGLSEENLDTVLSYTSTKGIPASKRFSGLLLHFFNHQTHHRGQLSTLLF